MEDGEAGVPMDPAVLHVVEEPKFELDPVTIQSHNMVVRLAQDQLLQVPAATQIRVQ